MKPIYEVSARDMSYKYEFNVREQAVQYRLKLQNAGYSKTYIRKIKGARRLSDYYKER